VESPSNSPASVETPEEPLKSVGESQGPQVAIDMRRARWTWGIGRWFVVIPRFSQMRRDNDRLQETRGRRSEKRKKDEMPIIFQVKREIKVIRWEETNVEEGKGQIMQQDSAEMLSILVGCKFSSR
jgi:hypothetical protein